MYMYVYVFYAQVLQSIKVTIDRHARSQENFEKRLGRARKTMIYRAHIRNAQLEESVASQIVSRLTKQSSVSTSHETETHFEHSRTKEAPSAEEPVPHARAHPGGQRSQVLRKTAGRHTKPKRMSTNTLFAIIVFDEFLKEIASLAHEHSCHNPSTLTPRTSL